MIKKVLFTFGLIAGIYGSDYKAHAQTPDSSTTDSFTIPKKKTDLTPTRHKMPSIDCDAIGFTYLNGIASFSMPDYITYIKVTMESENGEAFSSYVYAANPFWTVTLTPGEYSIECEANDGSLFEGTVYID